MNMKKILGVLLAFCFVMSVTVATAAAADPGWGKGKKEDDKWDKEKQKFKIVYKWKKIPGHWENKVVKKVVYKNHQKFVIKKVIKVWIPEKWIKIPVKIPIKRHNSHDGPRR
ncbi:MAG: hypothetical protein EHM20_01075 [Alphaproteobacteria bacterium]|nr:MAG: hypothetical protein EHM20_01075 [Alphaproteobacteria bacterium]